MRIERGKKVDSVSIKNGFRECPCKMRIERVLWGSQPLFSPAVSESVLVK